MKKYRKPEPCFVGEFIREKRKKMKLTLDSFGELLGGYDKSMVNRMEMGKSKSRRFVKMFLKLLNDEEIIDFNALLVDYYFGGEDE